MSMTVEDRVAMAFDVLHMLAQANETRLPAPVDISDRYGSITLTCHLPAHNSIEASIMIALTPHGSGLTLDASVVATNGHDLTRVTDLAYGTKWDPATVTRALNEALQAAYLFTVTPRKVA